MSKINAEIKNHLYELKETDYKEFMAKLIPTVDSESVLGIRTPALRNYAKDLAKRDDIDEYLHSLPHELFDENQLHAFILSELKDYDRCIKEVDNFLPYVDNWATCDQLSPKVFKKHKKELLASIKTWLKSKDTYTIRFAIGMLMQYFLDDEFDETYPKTVSKIKSDEYYINMMIAWYFATALAKQYDAILPYIEKNVLDKWTHNKTIQKAIESYRITDEQKEYLRSLKIK